MDFGSRVRLSDMVVQAKLRDKSWWLQPFFIRGRTYDVCIPHRFHGITSRQASSHLSFALTSGERASSRKRSTLPLLTLESVPQVL